MKNTIFTCKQKGLNLPTCSSWREIKSEMFSFSHDLPLRYTTFFYTRRLKKGDGFLFPFILPLLFFFASHWDGLMRRFISQIKHMPLFLQSYKERGKMLWFLQKHNETHVTWIEKGIARGNFMVPWSLFTLNIFYSSLFLHFTCYRLN